MSQYPPPYSSPYSYPGYPTDPYAALLAPARRAGLLLFILGGAMACMALCCGVLLIAPADLLQQQLDAMQQQTDQRLSVEQLQKEALFHTAFLLGMGVPLLGLGFPVRRGRKGAIIAAIVISGIVILRILLGVLVTFVQAMKIPMALSGLCILGVPLALFVLLMVWLVQALRASSNLHMAQTQYQQQYWQYQQHQQQYGQPGYGFPPQPPPPSDPNAGPPHDSAGPPPS